MKITFKFLMFSFALKEGNSCLLYNKKKLNLF